MRWLVRPVLVYALFAAVTTWPLIRHPSSLVGAPVGPGDPFLYLWVLGWGMHAVLHDPMSLLNGGVFNANIFHPAAGTLAYSDHLLLQSVVLSPIYAITGDVTFCYNVLLLGSLVASALAMHAFVREVTGSEGGAYLAGLAWGFGSYRFAHLLHVQLQALYFLPLTFLYLHRLIAAARRRDAVLLGVTFGLQAISSPYYAVIGGVGLVLGALSLLVVAGRRWDWALMRRLVLSGAIAGALVVPFALVYLRVQQSEGFGRTLYEASRSAAYVSSYLQVPPGNVIYGRTEVLRDHRAPPAGAPPRTGPERELFPGVTILVLAAFGIWRARRADARPLVVAMSVVALAGFILSLGPDGVRSVYATLHRYVFGFQAIRAPARFAVLLFLGVSTLAALGWRELAARLATQRPALSAVPALVIAAAALELFHLPVTLAAAPPLQTAVGRWLQHEPTPGAVAVLPLTIDVDNTPAMVQSLEHRRPLLNGYSGQRPAYYPSLVDALSAFPSEEALLALLESDVRFVVTPEPTTTHGLLTPLVERVRFDEGTIYELRWTPDIEAHVRTHTAIEPPPPGPIPFREGERASYTVSWSGAGTLTAGTIEMRVEGPPYRFVVSADTAPWIARFYELHAVLTTVANDQLMPQQQERRMQEGSRSVNRTFVFDTDRGVIRIGASVEDARSPQAVTLPLAAHARDAIATLFYARTLPLTAGARYRVPINDGGRNGIVDFTVSGPETILVQGRQRPALRLDPRIDRRVERRTPPSATVWLEPDGAHVPLAVEIAAVFGTVRLELTGYDAGLPRTSGANSPSGR